MNDLKEAIKRRRMAAPGITIIVQGEVEDEGSDDKKKDELAPDSQEALMAQQNGDMGEDKLNVAHPDAAQDLAMLESLVGEEADQAGPGRSSFVKAGRDSMKEKLKGMKK